MKQESYTSPNTIPKKVTEHVLASSTSGPSVGGRASYMCRKCKAHGRCAPVKRHKKSCPYLHCACLKCMLVDKGRKVVARQIALYRDQKGAQIDEPGLNTSGATSSSNTPCNTSPTFRSLTSVSHPIRGIDDSLIDVENNTRHHHNHHQSTTTSLSQEGSGGCLSYESLQQPQQALMGGSFSEIDYSISLGVGGGSGSLINGPHCRRCRNHNITITWKGHKKACPYRNCPCDPCGLIMVRKDTEKTLRDMVGHTDERQSSAKSSSLYTCPASHLAMSSTVPASHNQLLSLHNPHGHSSYLSSLGGVGGASAMSPGDPGSYCSPSPQGGGGLVGTPSTGKLCGAMQDSSELQGLLGSTVHNMTGSNGSASSFTTMGCSTLHSDGSELMPPLTLGAPMSGMYPGYSGQLWNGLYPTSSSTTSDYKPAGYMHCPSYPYFSSTHYSTDPSNPSYLSLAGYC